MSDRPTSQLQVCESLIREHRQMELLLAQLEKHLDALSRPTYSIEAVQAVMDRIVPEMNTHFACEEQVLFPAVSPYHPMVLMEAEHEALMDLRQTLLDLLCPPVPGIEKTSQLQATGRQFISDMLDHIGREDAGIFPTCEQALSDSEKQDVIEGMEKLRAKAI